MPADDTGTGQAGCRELHASSRRAPRRSALLGSNYLHPKFPGADDSRRSPSRACRTADQTSRRERHRPRATGRRSPPGPPGWHATSLGPQLRAERKARCDVGPLNALGSAGSPRRPRSLGSLSEKKWRPPPHRLQAGGWLGAPLHFHGPVREQRSEACLPISRGRLPPGTNNAVCRVHVLWRTRYAESLLHGEARPPSWLRMSNSVRPGCHFIHLRSKIAREYYHSRNLVINITKTVIACYCLTQATPRL